MKLSSGHSYLELDKVDLLEADQPNANSTPDTDTENRKCQGTTILNYLHPI